MEIDAATVLPSIPNLIIVTLMAIVGISLMKYLLARVQVPGLSSLVAAV